MADYSKGHIPLGVMIVTGDPDKFGHKWHNSGKYKKKNLSNKRDFLGSNVDNCS